MQNQSDCARTAEGASAARAAIAHPQPTRMAADIPADTRTLVAFMLPSTPYSVRLARFYVCSALSYHGLAAVAPDAETVASELVTNAVTHAGGLVVGLEVLHLGGSGAVAVIVSDVSPRVPVLRAPADDFEHWRGLCVVDALSTRWGWLPQDPGKAVYALFAGRE